MVPGRTKGPGWTEGEERLAAERKRRKKLERERAVLLRIARLAADGSTTAGQMCLALNEARRRGILR